MTRKLYHLPFSPFCRKIRVQLAEKRLPVELIEEAVWKGREEFFALNPAGDVPVLVEDEEVLCGAYAISEFLEETHTMPPLMGADYKQRANIRRMVQWFDEKFHDEVSRPILFEKFYRRVLQMGGPDSDMIRMAKESMQYHIEYMAEVLRSQSWLGGDLFSLADISAAAHISALDYLGDISWKDAQPIKEWYALVKSRPSFRALLADKVQGIRPPEHYDNPAFCIIFSRSSGS